MSKDPTFEEIIRDHARHCADVVVTISKFNPEEAKRLERDLYKIMQPPWVDFDDVKVKMIMALERINITIRSEAERLGFDLDEHVRSRDSARPN